MSRPLALAAAPALAMLGIAAVPTVASAATIAPSAPCYASQYRPTSAGGTQYQPITGTITGGTPGGRFQISGVGGKAGFQSGNFDAAGNATYTLSEGFSTAGIYPSAGRTVKLEVKEFGASGTLTTGTTSIKTSTIAIDVALRPRSPRSKRVVRVSAPAFAGQKLYGFIVRGKSGKKVLRKFSLGTGNTCGYARTRAVVAPRNYATGNYYLYINAGSKLNKDKAIGNGFRIRRSAF
ncbi:hypothetical protein [Patulibacter minatonensis]|uniref:hypothetical protein n=1 Tax=Patulibacter minatonensis TaxID=298163 RepID=UPI00047BA01A|nr:hypothetical protein [Patulibacter minatonensis]